MDAIIRFQNGLQATLSPTGWQCADAVMQRSLELLYGLKTVTGYNPNPVANQADKAARALGATLVQAPETEWVEGVVY
jgi:hypothetical protein